jgi:cell division septum initiation protein DivIVA
LKIEDGLFEQERTKNEELEQEIANLKRKLKNKEEIIKDLRNQNQNLVKTNQKLTDLNEQTEKEKHNFYQYMESLKGTNKGQKLFELTRLERENKVLESEKEKILVESQKANQQTKMINKENIKEYQNILRQLELDNNKNLNLIDHHAKENANLKVQLTFFEKLSEKLKNRLVYFLTEEEFLIKQLLHLRNSGQIEEAKSLQSFYSKYAVDV